MPKVKLTNRGIESLASGKWMIDYMDDGLPGFGVRVHQNGRKSFFVRYASEGKRRRLTLGTYPSLGLSEARTKAKEIIGRIAQGGDPQGKRNADRQAPTFADLAEEYIERHAKVKKRRWEEDQRMIAADLLPAWKYRKAKDISRRDVSNLLDGIVERGAPVMANRTKALISKIYNFGIGRDIVEHNPAFRVPMPTKNRQRDRVLSESEIRAFWQSLDILDPVMAATFKMRLVTAQRGLEVLTMRWQDIDGDWWTIPAEKAKNGLAHRVPLSPQALVLLEELRAVTGDSEWVFESSRAPGLHYKSVTRPASRVAEAAEIENFTAHDLRRTAASHMTSTGISRLVVSKILNHAESGITAVYDRHSYDIEKRKALTQWGKQLDQILCNR